MLAWLQILLELPTLKAVDINPLISFFNMTKQLQELIETAFRVKVFFKTASYELFHYEDGSYADFHVQKVVDLSTLIRVANGLELKFFAADGFMIVRLFERDCY